MGLRRSLEGVVTATLVLCASLSTTTAFVGHEHGRRPQAFSGQQAMTPTATNYLSSQRSFPNHNLSHSRKTLRSLYGMFSNNDELVGTDRYKACIPYLLPLLDGELWGKYIYEQVPPLGFLDSLFIGPLYETYSQIPFIGLILFVALTLGTRGNMEIDRNVRFNAQQACVIDIALIVPELIGSGFEGEDIPRWLEAPCMNFVWYFYMSAVLYSIYCNLQGKKPDGLPWLSSYAERLVGPI